MAALPASSEAAHGSELLAWALAYLPAYFSDAPAPFHAELLDDLALSQRRLIARVAPRGHAKSTCAALAYPLWCACEKRRHNIVVITQEASLATQFVRDIRHELQTNEALIERYGELLRQPRANPSAGRPAKPASDRPTCKPVRRTPPKSAAPAAAARAAGLPVRTKITEHFFQTSSGVTIQARSVGASLRGARVGAARPDLIICDDIERDSVVRTPEGRRKLELWLRRVVMPALAPDGQLVVVGSILHYDSLLAGLRDRQRWARWDYRVYRALEADALPEGGFRLRALWAGRWPVEKLQEERERVGSLAFEQEYQANPIDDSLRVFRPEWLRPRAASAPDAARLTTLIAVDPATGVSGGDFFALWVGGVERETGVIHTLALTLERVGIVEQVKRIVAAWRRWRPVKIGIETTAYQAALKDVLDDHGRRGGLYLPVVALRKLGNKRARIEGLAPLLESGSFQLPRVMEPEVELQFLQFPKSPHDDAPDVCAMGVELARTLRASGPIDGASAARVNPFVRRGGW